MKMLCRLLGHRWRVNGSPGLYLTRCSRCKTYA